MSKEEKIDNKEPMKLTCGIVMPISSIGECGSEYWVEVKAIIT